MPLPSPISVLPLLTPEQTRRNLLAWAASFPFICWLDTCGSEADEYGEVEWLFGVSRAGFSHPEDWQPDQWILGALPYDLALHGDPRLQVPSGPGIEWPGQPGFRPELLLLRPRNTDELWVMTDTPGLEGWKDCLENDLQTAPPPDMGEFEAAWDRPTYLEAVAATREYIRNGDCYELNLAQLFSASGRLDQPCELFLRLTGISPVPFAGYFRHGQRHLICASPERFLRYDGTALLTQPIKGTARRGKTVSEDHALKSELAASEKERAENVMIVDLSRHDLNRFCEPGSVIVPHLFEVQSFAQVHQLVSTVQGRLREEVKPMEALLGIFPPGSMTGAPKFRVMQLISGLEPVRRGLYAGSLGYVRPDGGFDFNVVIRSLIYDEEQQRLDYHVGGAITYDSVAEEEYEETLLKAKAIRALWAGSGDNSDAGGKSNGLREEGRSGVR